MVDMFVMSYLLKCIYKGTKLILVGDCDQLSSVGPGSVLKDLIASEKVVTVHLDKIFRQAAKSKIILNAHRVNNGEPFLTKEDEDYTEETMEDFFYINESSQERILEQVLSLCTGRLKNYGDYDFFQSIQVLTPTKKGMLGTRELNKALQERLNPNLYDRVRNADYVAHEAYCLDREEKRFHANEKNHSTVLSASQVMENLQVKNLILYHTKETHGASRKELYQEEAKTVFSGNVIVPEDLEEIKILKKER